MSYKSKISVHFSHTDMAGICYFNQVFNLFHDQYEEFVKSTLCAKKEWFNNPEWVVPIRHIESEYLRPLMAFEDYEIAIAVTHRGDTSFQLSTEISKDGKPHCQITSTHVFVDKKTMKPRAIPEEFSKTLAL